MNPRHLYISVVVPAYNESERIIATLRSIDAFLRTKSFSYEIIVANDGSSDDTASCVRTLMTEIPHLALLDNVLNKGKGSAVRQAMLEAQGTYRLFMDADNSTPIDYLDEFLKAAEQGADLVISSRKIKGAHIEVNQHSLRALGSIVFTKIVSILIPLRIQDTQNGFKLFSAHAARLVFKRQHIERWAFDVEILAISRLYGLRIKELPIVWKNDDRSRMTLLGAARMLKEIIEVKIRLALGRYGLYSASLADVRYLTLGKFMLFGALNTVVDWVWYIALSRSVSFFATHLVFTKGLAFLIGSVPIFITNAYWVFPDKEAVTTTDLIKLYSILSIAFFINAFTTSLFISLGMWDISAVILATGVSFLWNISLAWFLLIKNRIPTFASVFTPSY